MKNGNFGVPVVNIPITGRMVEEPKMHSTEAHLSQGHRWHEALSKSLGIAVSQIAIDSLSDIEERVAAMRVVRGRIGGKSQLNQIMWSVWDDVMVHTVRHDLKQLQDAQTRTYQGSSDPLFEAMEIHNERIRLGKKAIREMFHATPLNLNQKSTGPVKAKDWE